MILRGSLARTSLQLAVVPDLDVRASGSPGCTSPWTTCRGSGIVYGLTVAEASSLAGFLHAQGHEVAAVHRAAPPPDERERIEARCEANEVKAVVATSALGMGYDKPDLAFCIHVGSPDSPVAVLPAGRPRRPRARHGRRGAAAGHESDRRLGVLRHRDHARSRDG